MIRKLNEKISVVELKRYKVVYLSLAILLPVIIGLALFVFDKDITLADYLFYAIVTVMCEIIVLSNYSSVKRGIRLLSEINEKSERYSLTHTDAWETFSDHLENDNRIFNLKRRAGYDVYLKHLVDYTQHALSVNKKDQYVLSGRELESFMRAVKDLVKHINPEAPEGVYQYILNHSEYTLLNILRQEKGLK